MYPEWCALSRYSKVSQGSLRVVMAASVLLLTACGGGGGESGAAATRHAEAPTELSTNSRALADHQAPAAFGFDNFRQVSLQVDLAELTRDLVGSVFVVKVSDSQLNTLYLSGFALRDQVAIEFSVPRAEHRLWLEVYSDVGQQNSVLQEISL